MGFVVLIRHILPMMVSFDSQIGIVDEREERGRKEEEFIPFHQSIEKKR